MDMSIPVSYLEEKRLFARNAPLGTVFPKNKRYSHLQFWTPSVVCNSSANSLEDDYFSGSYGASFP